MDLLYIHQPAGNWLAGYRMLEKRIERAKQNPLVSRILKENIWKSWKQSGKLYLSLFRWEAHPYFTQKELRVTLDKYGIKLMSWYPLGHGDTALMNELVFAGLGKNMEKHLHRLFSVGILRWDLL